MKKTLFHSSTLAVLSLLNPGVIHAQITNPAIGNLGNNATAASEGATFASYFIYLWQAFITIGGLATLLYLVWGAFQWITAGGDSGNIEKARNRMTQAVIGMILLAASFTLVSVINTLFFDGQFDLLNLQF